MAEPDSQPAALDPKILEYLERHRPELLRAVERGDPVAITKLEQEYEGLEELLGLSHRARRKPLEGPRVVGPDARSLALAKVVARAASERYPQVAEFRRRHLNGRLLAGELVGRWLEAQCRAEGEAAPLYLLMPVSEYRFEGLVYAQDGPQEPGEGAMIGGALTEHRASARSEQEYLEGSRPFSPEEYAELLERSAARVRRGEVLLADPEHSYPPEARIPVPGGNRTGELPAPRAVRPLQLSYLVPTADQLRYVYLPDGSLTIRGDGVLAQLKWLAQYLMANVSCWPDEHQVVAFILSGWSPQLPKLRGTPRRAPYRPAARIEFSVDPRTSPGAVTAFYKQLRSFYRIGRDRTMNDKQLALALFTDEHGRSATPWHLLRERWNAEQPAWPYTTDDAAAGRFGTDCRNAWMRLTGDPWPVPTKRRKGGAR